MMNLTMITEPATGMTMSWGKETYKVRDQVQVGPFWLVTFENLRDPDISFNAQIKQYIGPGDDPKPPDDWGQFIEAWDGFLSGDVDATTLVERATELEVPGDWDLVS